MSHDELAIIDLPDDEIDFLDYMRFLELELQRETCPFDDDSNGH